MGVYRPSLLVVVVEEIQPSQPVTFWTTKLGWVDLENNPGDSRLPNGIGTPHTGRTTGLKGLVWAVDKNTTIGLVNNGVTYRTW